MLLSLTQTIHLELGKTLVKTGQSMKELTKIVYTSDLVNHKGTKKEVDKLIDKLKKAADELPKSTTGEEIQFNAETLNSLNNTYKRLNWALPDDQTLDKLTDAVLGELDKTRIAKEYEKIKERSLFSTGIATASLAGAAYIGATISMFMYATAAYSGILQKVSKKESSFNTIWANLGIMFGTYSIQLMNDVAEDKTKAAVGLALNLIHLPAYALGIKTIRYFQEKLRYKSTTNTLRKVKKKMDNMVRIGIALREADKGLGYVDRICKGEDRCIEEYQTQIDKFENILSKYIKGKTNYEEVVKSRIKYIPKEENNTKTYITPQTRKESEKKVGYSQEEYEAMKAKEVELEAKTNRKRKKQTTNLETQSVETDICEEENTPNITFSDNLLSMKKRSQIGGYKITTLMDLTQQKIEYNQKGELIRDAQSAQIMLQKIRSRHNLAPDVNVYKMQPIGSMRALYIRNNGDIKVLEIMTHGDYDNLMKNL